MVSLLGHIIGYLYSRKQSTSLIGKIMNEYMTFHYGKLRQKLIIVSHCRVYCYLFIIYLCSFSTVHVILSTRNLIEDFDIGYYSSDSLILVSFKLVMHSIPGQGYRSCINNGCFFGSMYICGTSM